MRLSTIFATCFVSLTLLLPTSAIAGVRCNSDPEEKLKPYLAEFGLDELPEPFIPPNITFVLAVKTGNLLYLSGNGPALPDGGGFITGKVPLDLSVEDAQRAARLTAINQLAVIKKEIGSLRRVRRIVKVFGMVNASDDFTAHPSIINGASDLFVDVFGDCGFHARSAVGVASLPFGIPVEIDMVIELRRWRRHYW